MKPIDILIELPEPYRSDATQLLALCIWREARGESLAAKIGVAWTVRNRCLMSPAQGFHPDVAGNVLKPWAFSSFNAGDPNATKYPAYADRSWIDSLTAAASTDPDPTMGACFYFSPPLLGPPRAWGPVEHSATIGTLHFYRLQTSAKVIS